MSMETKTGNRSIKMLFNHNPITIVVFLKSPNYV